MRYKSILSIFGFITMILLSVTIESCQNKLASSNNKSKPIAQKNNLSPINTAKTDVTTMAKNFAKTNLDTLNKIKQDSLKKPQLVIFLRHFG